MEIDAPVRHKDGVVIHLAGREDVLAARQAAALHGAGVSKHLLGGAVGQHPPGVHHGDLPTHVVGFIPAVGHQQDIAGEIRQQGQQVHLQLIPQVAVDGRERLVQQQGLGPGDQHPGQRHPLGLPRPESWAGRRSSSPSSLSRWMACSKAACFLAASFSRRRPVKMLARTVMFGKSA